MAGAALIILDGWGLAPPGPGNGVTLARTPVVDRLDAVCPRTTLQTSGPWVGLPEGQMGNSEVGHLTLGAGRVIGMDLGRIGDAIASGELAHNPVLRDAFGTGRRLHVMGLCSTGGVHSHIDHMIALGRLAVGAGKELYFHAFMDGRDTPPRAGAEYLRRLREVAPVASVCGRYYAMDRDQRWDRTERAYRLLVEGKGERSNDVVAAVEASYERGVTDEFIEPISAGLAVVEDEDAVLFANFRADRARQITEALTAPAFDAFARESRPRLHFVQMTPYRDDFELPVLFGAEQPPDVVGEVLARSGIANLRLAETEKYAHVTYFFNGGVEAPFEGEQRVLIPSPKVATYDLQPEMSAPGVAAAGAEAIRSGDFGAMILNFANPDMVGHTGVVEAVVRACEAVDAALGEVLDAAREAGWSALVTADHGNAECLIDPDTGGPHTAHTTHPVPCWLVGGDTPLRDGGSLQDVGPTLLGLLGLPVPGPMTGRDLRGA